MTIIIFWLLLLFLNESNNNWLRGVSDAEKRIHRRDGAHETAHSPGLQVTVCCSKKVAVVVSQVEITFAAFKVTVVCEDDFVFLSPRFFSSNKHRFLKNCNRIDYRTICMETAGHFANPFVGFVVVSKKVSKLLFSTLKSDWLAIDIVGLDNVDDQRRDLSIQKGILVKPFQLQASALFPNFRWVSKGLLLS